MCAHAGYGFDIQAILQITQTLRIDIHDSDIVIFIRQDIGDGRANGAGA
jgi:hypothetical protein